MCSQEVENASITSIQRRVVTISVCGKKDIIACVHLNGGSSHGFCRIGIGLLSQSQTILHIGMTLLIGFEVRTACMWA